MIDFDSAAVTDFAAGMRAQVEDGTFAALSAAERAQRVLYLLDAMDTFARAHGALQAAYSETARQAEELLAMLRRQSGNEAPVH